MIERNEDFWAFARTLLQQLSSADLIGPKETKLQDQKRLDIRDVIQQEVRRLIVPSLDKDASSCAFVTPYVLIDSATMPVHLPVDAVFDAVCVEGKFSAQTVAHHDVVFNRMLVFENAPSSPSRIADLRKNSITWWIWSQRDLLKDVITFVYSADKGLRIEGGVGGSVSSPGKFASQVACFKEEGMNWYIEHLFAAKQWQGFRYTHIPHPLAGDWPHDTSLVLGSGAYIMIAEPAKVSAPVVSVVSAFVEAMASAVLIAMSKFQQTHVRSLAVVKDILTKLRKAQHDVSILQDDLDQQVSGMEGCPLLGLLLPKQVCRIVPKEDGNVVLYGSGSSQTRSLKHNWNQDTIEADRDGFVFQMAPLAYQAVTMAPRETARLFAHHLEDLDCVAEWVSGFLKDDAFVSGWESQQMGWQAFVPGLASLVREWSDWLAEPSKAAGADWGEAFEVLKNVVWRPSDKIDERGWPMPTLGLVGARLADLHARNSVVLSADAFKQCREHSDRWLKAPIDGIGLVLDFAIALGGAKNGWQPVETSVAVCNRGEEDVVQIIFRTVKEVPDLGKVDRAGAVTRAFLRCAGLVSQCQEDRREFIFDAMLIPR